MIGSALLAAVSIALDRWEESGGESDLIGHLDEATDALVEGVGDLQPSQRAHDTPAKGRRRG